MTDKNDFIPILRNQLYTAPSTFKPESLLREARLEVGIIGRVVGASFAVWRRNCLPVIAVYW